METGSLAETSGSLAMTRVMKRKRPNDRLAGRDDFPLRWAEDRCKRVLFVS